MRHRSKSRSPSTTFITNLLHSKSTYFYKRWRDLIPCACTLILLAGLYITVNPTSILYANPVYADISTMPSGTTTNPDDYTSSLSLAVTDSIDQTTHASAGEVAFRTNTFKVNASYYLNYDIYVSGLSGQTSNLIGKDNPTSQVAGTTANTTPNNFTNNTWGYAITTNTAAGSESTLSYNPVPNFSNSVPSAYQYDMSQDTESNTYKIAFAALIAPGMPVDHYSTNVMLSVVGEPGRIIHNLTELTKMEDMTGEICTNSTEDHAAQLTDSRDGKTYWVGKLKDGNCWMTQNLDYDDPDSTRVASPSNWTSTDASYRAYFDAGDYVWSNYSSSSWTSCSTTSGLNSCTSKGWSLLSSIDTDNQAFMKHYHVGNYYSHNAAKSTICPTNWTLPTSHNSNTGSFDHLLTGLTGKTISQSPYFYTPAGKISSGSIGSLGTAGYYRSSTDRHPSSSYHLYFTSGSLEADYSHANSGDHHEGMSVRCVFIP